MTRFYQEITGVLGDYWKKDATKRVHDYVEEAKVKADVDSNGAIRWKNNGNYLMDDYCEVLEYAGYPFSREATKAARDAQVAEQLAAYRANPPMMTDEYIAEMRAAFGNGTSVVDVISGKQILL